MFVFRLQNKTDRNGPFHTEGNTDAFLKENGKLNEDNHKHIGIMDSLTDDEHDHLSCGIHLYFFESLERLFSVFKIIDLDLFFKHWDVLSIDTYEIDEDCFYVLEDEQVAIVKSVVRERACVMEIEEYKEHIYS